MTGTIVTIFQPGGWPIGVVATCLCVATPMAVAAKNQRRKAARGLARAQALARKTRPPASAKGRGGKALPKVPVRPATALPRYKSGSR